MRNNRGSALFSVLGIIIVILVAFLIFQNFKNRRSRAVEINKDQYYAVLLTNGQAYFGKLWKIGTPYPILTDVYYIQSQVNQQTNQVSNILVKRGNEWHAPDRMILNREHILFIEPVSPTSRVAELIKDQKKQGK